MAFRPNVACVEWTAPVDYRRACDGDHAEDLRGPGVYLIERNGEPLYVGMSLHCVQSRIRQHAEASARQHPFALIARDALAGRTSLTVRKLVIVAGRTLSSCESQVQRALKPHFNSINPRWRHVPVLPDRKAA